MNKKSYSPAEPITDLRKIKIAECGEPLRSYIGVSNRILIANPRWVYERFHYLRVSVLDMLVLAAGRLPKGYKIGILEGWRPPYIQNRMYLSSWARWERRHPEWSDVQLRRVVNRFTAPMNSKVPPPHSTGGAFDLVLLDSNGNELDVTSPFQAFDPQSYAMENPSLSQEAIHNRRILQQCFSDVKISNYPSEWWHWSYGDQGWAYREQEAHAIFGATEPKDWVPNTADSTEELLERHDRANF